MKYAFNSDEDPVHDFMITVITALCGNKYPGGLGYPDPLFNVDLIAKQYLGLVKNILKSSMYEIEMKPLSKTFREWREIS